ncbi:hypothetical protein [Lactobacillus delbrueckii]|uniref:hypothetical protein n=1 Tax=Lactobacillus delbrueckii TaxID=1584 RepID=UPI0038731978
MHGRRACGHHFQSLPTNPGGSHVRERERDLPTDRRADGKVHQRFHFTPPEVHTRGYIAITGSLIEYLLAKLLSFQGFIVLFGVGSLSYTIKSAYVEHFLETFFNFFVNFISMTENALQ